MFIFTCATTGRPEHGTRRANPDNSPFTSLLENDYYKNLTEQDIRNYIDIEKHFSSFNFISTEGSHHPDLYFWGIKK